ncbi:MAG TPA: hypothetical protein VEI82_04970 [Myxococcota bacterium]|nr:hypothetical protein [Myxococcota bacterium]
METRIWLAAAALALVGLAALSRGARRRRRRSIRGMLDGSRPCAVRTRS